MVGKLSKDTNLKFVYIHGWGGSRKSLEPLSLEIANQLQNQGVASQKLIIELPGFGDTELPYQFQFKDYVGYIEQRLKGFIGDNDQLVVITHSFGGKVLARMAINKQVPNAKLVFINASILKPKYSLKRELIRGLVKLYGPIKSLMFKLELENVQKSLQKAFYKYVVKARDYQKLDEEGNILLKQTFLNVVHVYFKAEEVRQITNQTLILWGEADRDTPLWMGQKLHSLIGKSRLKTFPDATHGLPLHQPDLCAREIVNFVENT